MNIQMSEFLRKMFDENQTSIVNLFGDIIKMLEDLPLGRRLTAIRMFKELLEDQILKNAKEEQEED